MGGAGFLTFYTCCALAGSFAQVVFSPGHLSLGASGATNGAVLWFATVSPWSQLLLFGEYSIIKQGNALAVPYPLFEGQLKFKTQQNQGQNSRVDPELRAFAQFLNSL